MKKQNKKRIISFILSVMMILSLVPTAAFAKEKAGISRKPEGTPIYNQQELASINVSDSGVYYLANDIQLTGEWTPLKSFRGVLDGNGHKITGMNVTKGLNDGYDAYKFGLFEEIVGAGEVKNLGLEGTIYISDEKLGPDAIGVSAGLLAGIISNDYYNPEGTARISNCWVKGEIVDESKLTQKFIGGFTGMYNGGIGDNCYSAVVGSPMIGQHNSFVKMSNFYYDNNLYTGSIAAKGVTGKTTEFMKSQEFVDLLNANKGESLDWIKSENGYPYQEEKEVPLVKNIDVYTVEDLLAINDDLSANYTLMNDIDLQGVKWTMIGNKTTPFTGSLNGNGYAIKNLKYTEEGKESAVGLISHLTGNVKNLGIEGAIVTISSIWPDDVGVIAGVNKGRIENCYTTGVEITIKSSYTRSGMIAGGNNGGIISNCYGSGVGSRGDVASGADGTYKNAYYNSDLLTPISANKSVVGKTTTEMQDEAFVELLNANTSEGIKWIKVEGSYPDQVKEQAPIKPELPAVDEETVKEQIKAINEIRGKIANSLKDTKDPWSIMSMVANGNKDDLINVADFIKESYEAISTSNNIYEIERTIIGLSAIGVDVRKLSNGTDTINALEILANQDLSSLINATIFGLVAYDSKEYDIPNNSKYTREDLITMILDKQSEKGGWALVGRGEDTDMTAMALHSLAPYYIAENAEAAGISGELYEKVKDSVEKAIDLLSIMQLADGSYGSDKYTASSNANSTSMVINTLSALGIDSIRDSRFVKNEKTIINGLLKFKTEDGKGFGFKDNKYNAMATEQGFRGLVSYDKFDENKTPYNIYQCGKNSTEAVPNPNPTPGGDAGNGSEGSDSVVEDKEESTNQNKNNLDKLPQTGGLSGMLPLAGMGLLAAGAAILSKKKVK